MHACRGTNTGAVWSLHCCPSNGLVAYGGEDGEVAIFKEPMLQDSRHRRAHTAVAGQLFGLRIVPMLVLCMCVEPQVMCSEAIIIMHHPHHHAIMLSNSASKHVCFLFMEDVVKALKGSHFLAVCGTQDVSCRFAHKGRRNRVEACPVLHTTCCRHISGSQTWQAQRPCTCQPICASGECQPACPVQMYQRQYLS